jgi:hypothetical protein
MSLDVSLNRIKYVSYDMETFAPENEELYWANITHNLGKMADKAGIYDALWRPYRLHKDYNHYDIYEDEIAFEESITIYAKDIVKIVEKGLKKLINKPDYYAKFNSPNGWGTYENFVPWVERYLEALKQYPESKVLVDR